MINIRRPVLRLFSIAIAVSGLLLAFGYGCAEPGASGMNIDFRQEMRGFVQAISGYAKNTRSNFIVIPQNGAELVSVTGNDDGPPDKAYLTAIDGMGQESLFYGFSGDGRKTPKNERIWTSAFLDMAKSESGVVILVTDYCRTHTCMSDSFRKNAKKGYVSFAADHRELDNIPSYPDNLVNENDNKITRLSEVKNFLYLINPEDFSNRQEFADAVAATNYDLVIMDFFFKGKEYTRQQLKQMKRKRNGGKRLLIAYMSIGEAEDYRYYWQCSWKSNPPMWLRAEDPRWEGNYYVEYWNADWQKIIYGSDDSYLDRIINAGFDGVYLDIIDAFEYFEENRSRKSLRQEVDLPRAADARQGAVNSGIGRGRCRDL